MLERKAKLCWAGTQRLTIRTFLWEGKAWKNPTLEGCRHFFGLFPGLPSSSGCLLHRQAPTELKACSTERESSRAWGRNSEACWLPGGDWARDCCSLLPWADILSVRNLIHSGRVITQLVAASESFNKKWVCLMKRRWLCGSSSSSCLN